MNEVKKGKEYDNDDIQFEIDYSNEEKIEIENYLNAKLGENISMEKWKGKEYDYKGNLIFEGFSSFE